MFEIIQKNNILHKFSNDLLVLTYCLLKDYVWNIIENPPGCELFRYLKDCKNFKGKICIGYITSSSDESEDESEDESGNIIKGCDNKEE